MPTLCIDPLRMLQLRTKGRDNALRCPRMVRALQGESSTGLALQQRGVPTNNANGDSSDHDRSRLAAQQDHERPAIGEEIRFH